MTYATKWSGTARISRTCDVLVQTVTRWCRLKQVQSKQLPSGTWRVLVYAEGPDRGWPVETSEQIELPSAS